MNTYTPSLFINHHREKLEGAIAYFAGNTSHCYTLKLFKLLNFLDFEHYRQTGRSVTGLDYYAFELGPVPTKLYYQIQSDDAEKVAGLAVRETMDDLSNALVKREVKTKKIFDDSYFTPRELEIMERLVFFFKDINSDTMSQYSHDSKLPWKKIYGNGEGQGDIIPYELALQSESIVKDEPTIEEEERLLLDDIFQGVRSHKQLKNPWRKHGNIPL